MERLIGIALLVGVIVAAVPYVDDLTDRRVAGAEHDTSDRGPRTVALQAGRNGQFVLEVSVNGRSVEMLADTGASAVVLTEKDARRVGVDMRSLKFDIPVNTANGKTHAAAVMLDSIEVDGIEMDDVRAMVAKSDDLTTSLLGMTFLGRLANFNMAGDRLVLVE